MTHVRIRGFELYYETCGAGPSHVVIAHGALGSVAHGEAFGLRAAELAAHGFHVVTYDARGHGRSGYTLRPEDYQPEALAMDLLGLLDALGIERASICGTSMGASTALMLAALHPERVANLVLKAPSPFAEDMAVARGRLHPLASLYRWLGEPVTIGLVTLLSRRSQRAGIKALLEGQQRAAVEPLIRGFLSKPLEPDRLAEIAAPTLILTHPGDPLHPLRSGEILRARLARAQLLVAPSSTYWSENRARFAQVVASSLQDQAVAGAS
jgi:pimeloyl-ACP methyl ester carboxylesterase